MKKKRPIEEIIAFVLMLFCASGCTPVADGQERVNRLSGKIKSTQLTGFFTDDTMDLKFEYDSLDRLSVIQIRTTSGFESFSEMNVSYENNKVSVLARDFPQTGDIFYLNPGTNLIDSCDLYINGTLQFRTLTIRKSSQEISRIEQYIPDYPSSRYTFIDSTEYPSGQLSEFVANLFDLMLRINPTHYTFQYGSTPIRINTGPFGMEHHVTFLGIYYYLTTDVLGLRFGKGPDKVVQMHESRERKYPNTYEQVEYNYPVYNDTLVDMRMNTNLYDQDFTVINRYYP